MIENEKENQPEQKSVMKKWKDLLVSYFVNIKNYEDKISPLRTELIQQNNFSLESLFQLLDQNSKNFISLSDLIKFCNENNVQYDEKLLRRFLHNFDKDNDFSLNFFEFQSFLLPSNEQKLNENSKNNEKNEVSNEIKNIFAQILNEEINLIKESFEIAQKMKESQYFTSYESFIEIAGNDPYITEDSLYSFLLGNNVNINPNEIHQLIYRLDSDNDGKISFAEFQEIFFPLSENNSFSNNNLNNNFASSYNKFDNFNLSQNSNLGNSNRLLESNIFESSAFQTTKKNPNLDFYKTTNEYENPEFYNTGSVNDFGYKTFTKKNYNEIYDNRNDPMSKTMVSIKKNNKQNFNESSGDINTNDNTMKNSMKVSNNNCRCFCSCCPWCWTMPRNIHINIIPIHSPNRYNNSLRNSCQNFHKNRSFII